MARIYTEAGRKSYTCLATFYADNCTLYAAMVPDKQPKGGNDLIVLFVRIEYRQGTLHHVRIKSLIEYFLAARAYFEHLTQESSKQPEELDD